MNSIKIYVTGHTPRSQSVIESIKAVIKRHPGNGIEIQIIDVLENPEIADADNILVTPTIIYTAQDKQRRLVGNFEDIAKLENALFG